MARTYMKSVYSFPLAIFLFFLSSIPIVALIGAFQYIVGAQCIEGFTAHCPQGALDEAVVAGRAAFAHMAVALWLYGLAMLVLAGSMGRVELALVCHVVAVVAAWKGGV